MERKGSGPQAPSSQCCLLASSPGVLPASLLLASLGGSRCYHLPTPHPQWTDSPGRESALFGFSQLQSQLQSSRDASRVGSPGINRVPLRIAPLLARPFLVDIRKLRPS